MCDRFRLGELFDATKGLVPIEARVTRWSEASEDIRALRKMVKDGPLTIEPTATALFAASLMVSTVKNDESGNARLVKKGHNNMARDDVAAALLLAAGSWQRHYAPKEGEEDAGVSLAAVGL